MTPQASLAPPRSPLIAAGQTSESLTESLFDFVWSNLTELVYG